MGAPLNNTALILASGYEKKSKMHRRCNGFGNRRGAHTSLFPDLTIRKIAEIRSLNFRVNNQKRGKLAARELAVESFRKSARIRRNRSA